MFLFIVFSYLFASSESEIRSHSISLPNAIGSYDIVIEQHAIPQNLLAKAVKEALQRELNPQVTITYDRDSLAIANEIERFTSEGQIPTRSFEENRLNELIPEATSDSVSGKEQNTLRTLLVIRCVGLGAGLFIGTGSSLAVAAYAGILNYIMMEVLYIPKKNGHMRGVDFVNEVMGKTTAFQKARNPSVSSRQIAVTETFTNFLVNYTMNFAMLVPFIGMTQADFSTYLQAFTQSELYIKSAYLSVVVTFFLTSWKMAASRWEKLRQEKGIEIMKPKTQSRLINGIDFVMSFVNPGFWDGKFLNEVIVTTVGVSGFVAYFYQDIRDRFGARIQRIKDSFATFCQNLF